MKNHILLLICIVLLSMGCYKDTDDTPPAKVIVETEEVIVSTSISGAVIDLDGDPIRAYTVLVNDELHSISSDFFFLELNNAQKKGETFHIFKDGKQIGIQTQLLVENDINHMEIQQHAEYQEKVISSENKTIDLSNSIRADFTSTKWNGISNGQVTVEYINIENTNSLTPIGYNSISDVLAVDSKGGFYLSAKDQNDESITADQDAPIIIKTADLDEDINGLFVFDRENEIWVLVAEVASGDEVAVLGEGYYTFANYTTGVFVEGDVSKLGKPVAYQPMNWRLASLSNQVCATENGKWIALLPESEMVRMNLLNPCDESLQSETLDVELEDLFGQNLIISDDNNYQQLNITVLDCNGDTVTTPNLIVSSGDDANHYMFSEAYSDRWIAVCDEFSIAAVDEDTGDSGLPLPWSTAILDELDVLTLCGDYNQGYTVLKIRDEEEVYPAFDLEIEGERTILKSQEGNIKFIFKGMEKGMYDVNEVNVLIDDIEFGEKGYYIKCENSSDGCGIDNFNVTHYESEDSGIVRVTFSGTMWMQTLAPLVAGNFEIEGLIVIKN